jgi:hypothetical protein
LTVAFEKAAIVHDDATKEMSQPWHESQQMFLEGNLAEGVLPVEAKAMYLLLHATGPRWAIRGKIYASIIAIQLSAN